MYECVVFRYKSVLLRHSHDKLWRFPKACLSVRIVTSYNVVSGEKYFFSSSSSSSLTCID